MFNRLVILMFLLGYILGHLKAAFDIELLKYYIEFKQRHASFTFELM